MKDNISCRDLIPESYALKDLLPVDFDFDDYVELKSSNRDDYFLNRYKEMLFEKDEIQIRHREDIHILKNILIKLIYVITRDENSEAYKNYMELLENGLLDTIQRSS